LLCTACKSLYFDSFINMYCNNSQAKLIHDADSVQCRSLFDNSLFFILVSSYTCGYCLASFDIFNNIKDQVEILDLKVPVYFVCLSENNASEVFANFPNYKRLMKNDISWDKIEGNQPLIETIWRESVYPELVVLDSGKLYKSIVGVHVEEDINKLIFDINKSFGMPQN